MVKSKIWYFVEQSVSPARFCDKFQVYFAVFFVYSTFVTTQKKAHGEAMNRSLSCAVGFVSYCFFYSFPSASSR